MHPTPILPLWPQQTCYTPQNAAPGQNALLYHSPYNHTAATTAVAASAADFDATAAEAVSTAAVDAEYCLHVLSQIG